MPDLTTKLAVAAPVESWTLWRDRVEASTPRSVAAALRSTASGVPSVLVWVMASLVLRALPETEKLPSPRLELSIFFRSILMLSPSLAPI
ncbi:hypothetical protein D3C85_1467650 [compost metagenome]